MTILIFITDTTYFCLGDLASVENQNPHLPNGTLIVLFIDVDVSVPRAAHCEHRHHLGVRFRCRQNQRKKLYAGPSENTFASVASGMMSAIMKWEHNL